MDRLLAHSLLVVTGKGGVGKSTVAAALGLAADDCGLRLRRQSSRPNLAAMST
jgi:Mrp family chromosome partitioning ATPase